jgi:Nitroreductase family
MDWIELGNPTPRQGWKRVAQARWPSGEREPLPLDLPGSQVLFRDACALRRSQREFWPLKLEALSQLLELTCRVHFSISGMAQSSRPPPSAGALHPIRVLLHRFGEAHWTCYDPFDHALVRLHSDVEPTTVREALDAIMPGNDATLVLFAAEPGETLAKYENGCSLVWRDAGILQGYFALAAEALGLHLCLLGVTGEPWVSRLACARDLFGVGVAYVGASPDLQGSKPAHSEKR